MANKFLFTKNPTDEVWDMIRAANPDFADQLTPAIFSIKPPEAVNQHGYNSRLSITARAGTGWSGSLQLYVNRLNLRNRFNEHGNGQFYPKIYLNMGAANNTITTGQFQDKINEALGISLINEALVGASEPADVKNVSFKCPERNEGITISIPGATTRTNYRVDPDPANALKVTLVNTGTDIDTRMSKKNVLMFDSPEGTLYARGKVYVESTGKQSIPISLFNLDFTDLLGNGESDFVKQADNTWHVAKLQAVQDRLALYGINVTLDPAARGYNGALATGATWATASTVGYQANSTAVTELNPRFTHRVGLLITVEDAANYLPHYSSGTTHVIWLGINPGAV